ncbi:MAG: hypothetical protein HC806_09485, partial [Anaerolineae bacterium]|nr:hypothetical protein [Anaerolineae bacterium]
MTFFRTALARGLLGQVIGTLIGMAIVFVIRLIMGLAVFVPSSEALLGFGLDSRAAESGWALGGVFGAVAFMLMSGVTSDWIKWAKGISTPDHPHEEEGWKRYFNVSLDHKVIGIQYGVTSILIFLTAGLFA